MPDRPDAHMTTYLSGLWSRMKDHAAGLSTAYGPPIDGKATNDDEELLLWNQHTLTPEQVWDLWRQGRTPETAGMRILTPEEIGMQEFGNREKMAKSGGRVEPKDWYAYSDRMSQKAEAARVAAEPPPGPMTTDAGPPATGALSLPMDGRL